MAREMVATFVRLIQEDAFVAFDGADSIVEAAARLRVVNRVFRTIADAPHWAPATAVERVRAEAEQNLLDGAAHPAKSTSVLANLIAQYETAAWAEICKFLRKS